MHKEGSNIFLKRRAFGIAQAACTLALIAVIWWLCKNQFAIEILIANEDMPKYAAVISFIAGVIALCYLKAFTCILFMYLTAIALVYPNSDFIAFIKVFFYEMPIILFWILPTNIMG